MMPLQTDSMGGAPPEVADGGSQESPRGETRVVPRVVARRLPLYLAHVRALAALQTPTVSSEELGANIRRTPALVRRDLSHLGRLGTTGTGYSVQRLEERLSEAMALNAPHNIAVVGTDERALAIIGCSRLRQEGFEVAAVFHLGTAASKINGNRLSKPLEELVDSVRAMDIEIAAVSVPEGQARRVIEQVASSGVKAIVNIGPGSPTAPRDIIVYDLDPLLALRRASAELMNS